MVPNEKVKVWKNIAAVIGNRNRRSILRKIKFPNFFHMPAMNIITRPTLIRIGSLTLSGLASAIRIHMLSLFYTVTICEIETTIESSVCHSKQGEVL